MITIDSLLEGKAFDLANLKSSIEPHGYVIGGNWDYDRGSFDYKMNEEEGVYYYLRLPFHAVKGQLDSRYCTVQFERPFILAHRYEANIDQHGNVGVFSASFNQFQEPVEKDDEVPQQYVSIGKELVTQLEQLLLAPN